MMRTALPVPHGGPLNVNVNAHVVSVPLDADETVVGWGYGAVGEKPGQPSQFNSSAMRRPK